MARNPKKASKGKRAKKGKIQDLPAGKKAKGVKGGMYDTFMKYGSPTFSSTLLDFGK